MLGDDTLYGIELIESDQVAIVATSQIDPNRAYLDVMNQLEAIDQPEFDWARRITNQKRGSRGRLAIRLAILQALVDYNRAAITYSQLKEYWKNQVPQYLVHEDTKKIIIKHKMNPDDIASLAGYRTPLVNPPHPKPPIRLVLGLTDQQAQRPLILVSEPEMVPCSRPNNYKEFGEAPDDDPEALQLFAAKVRSGQPKFRESLLVAYGSRCMISGHGPEEVLEAAHIVPHSESGINALDNGLLLRADFHSLLDAGLLRIDPEMLTVQIDASLRDTPYQQLHGTTLLPRVDNSKMGKEYLRKRYR